MRGWWLAVVVALAVGCSGGVAEKATEGGSSAGDAGGGDVGGAPDGPHALDLLFVVDGSITMARHQSALAFSINALVDGLAAAGQVDLRAAVVTMDALSASQQGRFHHEPPKAFPPNSAERFASACLSDATCAEAMAESPDPGSWVCEPPPLADRLWTNNGAPLAACRYRCETAADCTAAFGRGALDVVWQCVAPGGDQMLRGCLRSAALPGCPEVLPAVADAAAAASLGLSVPELLRCLLVIGAAQDKNPQLEQGLRTAVLALDVAGPNGEQAAAFLRPEAWQLVVFVSDDEDCSVAGQTPDGPWLLPGESWGRCRTLGDTDGKGPRGEPLEPPGTVGPLEPVDSFASALRNINPDPSRVLVAALVGDVVFTRDDLPSADSDPLAALVCPDEHDPESIPPCEGASAEDCLECPDAFSPPGAPPCEDGAIEDCYERKVDSYYCSLQLPCSGAGATYVCAGPTGWADLGNRYLRLVSAFGDKGFRGNICVDFEENLAALAAFVVRHLDAAATAGGAHAGLAERPPTAVATEPRPWAR